MSQRSSEYAVLSTSLPEGTFSVREFRGTEGISDLFRFELDLTADSGADVPFEKLLGAAASLQLRGVPDRVGAEAAPRWFHGIVSSFGELQADSEFAHYRLELAPSLWLSTQRVGSRVFQQMSVPTILEEMLAEYRPVIDLRATYHEHNYCVQHDESDFTFLSRLMEEEGIFYWFTHDAHGHHLHVTDASASNPLLPEEKRVRFDSSGGGIRPEERIGRWRKSQKLGPASYRVWDHSFELPSDNLEALEQVPSTVRAGAVSHQLDLGRSRRLEIFDASGSYAHSFDGVDPSGSEQPGAVEKVFDQNRNTARIRMQEQTAASFGIEGASDCRRLGPGYRFELADHPKANGSYLLKRVEHRARLASERSGDSDAVLYENRFECLPDDLDYRPPRRTPRPTISGVQSATVVGPAGEEIYTDCYGRVKVQFRWDRFGRNDIGSSCWVRVAQASAGKGIGMVATPRIGQEVVVCFIDGDPDRPLIVGSVHKAEQSTVFDLPSEKKRTTLKTQSYSSGSDDYSGMVIDDTSGSEHFQMRAQNDMTTDVLSDHYQQIGSNHIVSIGGSKAEVVGSDHSQYVPSNKKVVVGMSASTTSPDSPWSFDSAVSGSGSGGDSYEDSSSATTTLGDITIGAYTTIIFGVDSKVVVGALDQIVAPVRVNVDVGLRASACILVAVDFVVGWNVQVTVGNRYDYSTGTHLVQGGSVNIKANATIDALIDLESAKWIALRSVSGTTIKSRGGNGISMEGTDGINTSAMLALDGNGARLGAVDRAEYDGAIDWKAIPGVAIDDTSAELHFNADCYVRITGGAIELRSSSACYIKLDGDDITMRAANITLQTEGTLSEQVGSLEVQIDSGDDGDDDDDDDGDDDDDDSYSSFDDDDDDDVTTELEVDVIEEEAEEDF